MAWLAALWSQFFRDDPIIEPARFLRANVTLGLFAIVVLVAAARHPERTPLAFALLVSATALTHVGGYALVFFAPSALARTLGAQGLTLFATSAALLVLSLWWTLRANTLSDIRYLPGVVTCLLLQAGLEVERFGPLALRKRWLRRAGVLLGATGDVALLAALIVRLARG